MSYTVLARRYRSRNFDEIVGQEPIARTLQNAIAGDRTAHAYLFCGTRGVGKTSMARIFAKALNVAPELEQAEQIGDAILRGDDLDVIEIDGASNRGVEEARELIAGAGLSPTRCRYKIYIIDEVHMLTREAFNALLKTMEEPPAHVKFILCTTEPHKVPATIQSRCQRFDFRPLASVRIAEHLRHLLEQEGIEADEEVVSEVARLGNGSMRDALSLLDRLLASGEPRLTIELLEQMIGVPDHTLVSTLVDAVAEGDAAAALERADQLLASGITVEQALELLTEHLRRLMIMAVCGAETDLLEISAEGRHAAQTQAAQFDAPGLVHMIALCDAVARSARGSSTGRALFDAAIVRLCLSHHLADIAALLDGAESRPPVAPASDGDRSVPAAGKKKAVERPLNPPRPETAPLRAAVPAAERLSEVKPAAALADTELWPTVQRFAARSKSDQARIEHLHFDGLEGRTVKLSVIETGAPMARFLATQGEQIAELIRRATDRQVRVEIDAAAARSGARPELPEGSLDEAASIPVVAEAMELFDATIIDVKDAPETEEPRHV